MSSQDGPSISGSEAEGNSQHAAGSVLGIAIEPIVQVLEHSIREFRGEFERPEIRRVVSEAVRTWPGTVESTMLTSIGCSPFCRPGSRSQAFEQTICWTDESVKTEWRVGRFRMYCFSPPPSDTGRYVRRFLQAHTYNCYPFQGSHSAQLSPNFTSTLSGTSSG